MSLLEEPAALYQCPYCSHGPFLSFYRLRRHARSKHYWGRCPVCGEVKTSLPHHAATEAMRYDADEGHKVLYALLAPANGPKRNRELRCRCVRLAIEKCRAVEARA